MIKPQNRKFQTYTDGWGTSWIVSDRRMKEVRQQIIHYDEYSVGLIRFWKAFVEDVQVKKAILVPESAKIIQGDLFVDHDGTQYEVVQVDRKDTRPVSKLVTLASAAVNYRGRS